MIELTRRDDGTFTATEQPEVGDTLTCDAFEPIGDETRDRHVVHYIVQRVERDGELCHVLSLEAGTTITVATAQ